MSIKNNTFVFGGLDNRCVFDLILMLIKPRSNAGFYFFDAVLKLIAPQGENILSLK